MVGPKLDHPAIIAGSGSVLLNPGQLTLVPARDGWRRELRCRCGEPITGYKVLVEACVGSLPGNMSDELRRGVRLSPRLHPELRGFMVVGAMAERSR